MITEKDAIEFKDHVAKGHCDKEELVGLIEEKRVGHRWCLIVKNPKKNGQRNVLFFNSKKSCILVSELIKAYDSDFITLYTKTY